MIWLDPCQIKPRLEFDQAWLSLGLKRLGLFGALEQKRKREKEALEAVNKRNQERAKRLRVMDSEDKEEEGGGGEAKEDVKEGEEREKG